MKAVLQHDLNGLFYCSGGVWVNSPQQALSFSSTADAEAFRDQQGIPAVRVVARMDPMLMSRMGFRAPGVYQQGE